MLARACARARRRWRRPAGARARARVWVPYLAWFFLNRVSRVWVTPLPEPDPHRYPDPNRPAPRLLECQQLRLLDCQLLGASVGQPTVGSKGCILSLGSNLLVPLGAL